MGTAFELTADETGLIGIHTGAEYSTLGVETVVVSGVGFFAENLAGIVKATIEAPAAAPGGAEE